MLHDERSLLLFLNKVDKDFSPPLSSKVDLKDYILKIQEKAELIIEEQNGLIRGLVILYCNDFETKIAYISLVGVLPEFRGMGIAKICMSQAINVAKEKGMKRIMIHSNNPVAVKIYNDLGFHIIEDGDRKLMSLSL